MTRETCRSPSDTTSIPLALAIKDTEPATRTKTGFDTAPAPHTGPSDPKFGFVDRSAYIWCQTARQVPESYNQQELNIWTRNSVRAAECRSTSITTAQMPTTPPSASRCTTNSTNKASAPYLTKHPTKTLKIAKAATSITEAAASNNIKCLTISL